MIFVDFPVELRVYLFVCHAFLLKEKAEGFRNGTSRLLKYDLR